MPKKTRFPHLHRQITRHGRTVWYFRRGHGRRVRMRGEYGSEAFLAAYAALLTGASASDGVLMRALRAANELGASWLTLAKDGTLRIELAVLPPPTRDEPPAKKPKSKTQSSHSTNSGATRPSASSREPAPMSAP
jgi:hypothetical protein